MCLSRSNTTPPKNNTLLLVFAKIWSGGGGGGAAAAGGGQCMMPKGHDALTITHKHHLATPIRSTTISTTHYLRNMPNLCSLYDLLSSKPIPFQLSGPYFNDKDTWLLATCQ